MSVLVTNQLMSLYTMEYLQFHLVCQIQLHLGVSKALVDQPYQRSRSIIKRSRSKQTIRRTTKQYGFAIRCDSQDEQIISVFAEMPLQLFFYGSGGRHTINRHPVTSGRRKKNPVPGQDITARTDAGTRLVSESYYIQDVKFESRYYQYHFSNNSSEQKWHPHAALCDHMVG